MGLFAMTFMMPVLQPLTASAAAGAGLGAFASGFAISADKQSMNKIKEFETCLNKYGNLVEKDMKGAKEMMSYLQ